MRHLARSLYGALILLTVSGTVASANDEHTVSFCFNEWPPYSTMVDGRAAGLSVNILREAAHRAGLDVRFEALPWKRCLQNVEDGDIDAVVDAAERAEFIHGDTSFTAYTNTFWVRADDGPSSFDEAAKGARRLGLVQGYVYGAALDKLFADSGMAIDMSIDDGTNIKKLGFGRTDIIVADFVSTRFFAAEKNLALRPLLPSHSHDRLFVSFNRERHAKLARIDDALRAMCADGWIWDIYIETLGLGPDVVLGERACVPGRANGGTG